MRAARGAEGSGGAWIELPLGSGQGWRGRGTGNVVYRVELPHEGKYRVWMRTLWGDGCTNALFLQINDSRRIVFGNDAIFKQWHWVRSLPLPFVAGVNYITVANHSDGVAFDKLIVTDDVRYQPEGLGEGVSRFYDGFAGCDADNTGSWELLSGTWRVVRAVGDSASGANDCIAQWAPEGGVAMAGYSSWSNYDMKVDLLFSGPATAAMIVGCSDATHEYRLRWTNGETDSEVALEHLVDGQTRTLTRARLAASGFDQWHTVDFVQTAATWQVSIDRSAVASIDAPEPIRGRVGLATIDSGGVYFDNVDVQFNR